MTDTYDNIIKLKCRIRDLKEDRRKLQEKLNLLNRLMKKDLIEALNDFKAMECLVYVELNNGSYLCQNYKLVLEYQDCCIKAYRTRDTSLNAYGNPVWDGSAYIEQDVYFHSYNIGHFHPTDRCSAFRNEIHGGLFYSWFKKNEKELTQLFRNKVYIPIDHISAKIEKLDSQISDLKIQIKDLEGGFFENENENENENEPPKYDPFLDNEDNINMDSFFNDIDNINEQSKEIEIKLKKILNKI